MTESCSCGAFIKTARYSRVKDWRNTHRHDMEPEQEPDKNGSEAHTQIAYQDDYDIVHARMGFNPNPVHREHA